MDIARPSKLLRGGFFVEEPFSTAGQKTQKMPSMVLSLRPQVATYSSFSLKFDRTDRPTGPTGDTVRSKKMQVSFSDLAERAFQLNRSFQNVIAAEICFTR